MPTNKPPIAAQQDLLGMPKGSYIQYQSASLALRLGNFVWPAQAAAAILLVWLLSEYGSTPMLLQWTILMACLSVAQGLICFRGAQLASKELPLKGWPRAFDMSILFIGLSWASFSLLLVPVADSEIQNFVGFIMGGAIIIYTGTQNVRYGVFAISISIVVVSRSYRLLVDTEGALGEWGAVMLLVFLSVMLGLAWMLRGITRTGFALQWEKARLVEELEEKAIELEAARAEADASNLEKSKFLAQASHDLRQPLHAMGLHLASLSQEKISPKVQLVTDRIGQSVEVLSKLFNSLLDVTLLDTRQLKPKSLGFDLHDLCGRVADEFSIAATAENMKITANTDDRLVIRSDALLVRRILQNLVSNAIRHSEGGEVSIETSTHDDQAYLVVRDTGKGIPEEEKTRMFEEFVKGDTSKSGLGLGLTIVSRLSNVLNVRVEVETNETIGTQFSVGPFQITELADHVEEEEPNYSSVECGRVLVIDDDRATLEATAALLSSWGWEIDARSTLNADEIRALDPPKLIISDFELAYGQTGLEIVDAVRRMHGPVPALIVTGSSQPETRRKIAEAGFLLLHKPVMPAQLRSAIISLLE